MSAPALTERQLTNITNEIRDTMVTTLCSKIMDENAQDSSLISGIIKKNLGEKINDVLSAPANEAKISSTITQAVNASLRQTIDGPLVLYSILDNKQSFDAVKILVTKIFANVYNNSTDKELAIFIKNLLTKLKDPPYTTWFKQDVTIAKGGGKSKTMRKRKIKNKRSKTYRNKLSIGGDMRGYMARKVGLKNAESAEKARHEINEQTKKARDDKMNARSEAGKAGIAKGWQQMKDAWAGKKPDDKSEPEKVSEKTDGEEKKSMKDKMKDKMKSMFGYGDKDPEGSEGAEGTDTGAEGADTGAGAGSGAGVGSGVDVTDELYKEYNEEIINRLSKRLDETEEDILERVLNAAYKYSIDNGSEILDNINKAIYDTIRLNSIASETTNVIIIQSLYASSMDVQDAIEKSYDDFRKEEMATGAKGKIIFNPKTTSFIDKFLQHLTIRIKNVINLT